MSDHPRGLTRDHVVWAYRLLLDRDPESEDVIGPKLAGSRDTRELRHHLMTSAEFLDKNRDYAHTNDSTVLIKELHGPGSARLFVDLSDHVIGLSIVRGHYETEEIRLVRSWLRIGDCAIDAGAHIGFFTMQMAEAVGPTGHVDAFEPFAPNADLLDRSTAENRFGDRITLHRAALGASTETASLTFARETLNSGGAYLLRPGTAPLAGNAAQTVSVVALDEAPIRRPVRLIKMDVEGAEPQVVAGAARLLRADRPLLLSELHPTQLERASGVSADAFLKQMTALGYRAHGIENGAVGAPIERAPDAIVSAAFVPIA